MNTLYILLKVFNIPSTWLVFSEGYTYFKNFSKEYIEKKNHFIYINGIIRIK